MIKSMQQTFQVSDVLPQTLSYYKGELNLIKLILKVSAHPTCYGKKVFDNLMKHVDESIKDKIFDLYLFNCFWDEKCVHLLDGKNQYATWFFNQAVDNDTLKKELSVFEVEKDRYRTLSLLEYDEYIKSTDKEAFRKRNLPSRHAVRDFGEDLSILLDASCFEENLRKNFTIEDFKAYTSKFMDISILGMNIKLLQLFGSDQKVEDHFMKLKDTDLKVVGSAVRFNYFWKALNYKVIPEVVEEIFTNMQEMKDSGSPEYIKNQDKVNKWVLKNPEYKDKFALFKAIEDPENFMAESSDSISFHLYLNSLQKLSKKNKMGVYKENDYLNFMENNLNKLKELEYFKNYLGSSVNTNLKEDRVLTITFAYFDSEENKSKIKSLYEQAIIKIVDSHYNIEEKTIKIMMEELMLEMIIPKKDEGGKKAVFKV